MAFTLLLSLYLRTPSNKMLSIQVHLNLQRLDCRTVLLPSLGGIKIFFHIGKWLFSLCETCSSLTCASGTVWNFSSVAWHVRLWSLSTYLQARLLTILYPSAFEIASKVPLHQPTVKLYDSIVPNPFETLLTWYEVGLKKIPRKGISNHPPPIRHHTIAAEIHRPDLLLRHLESHHHQPPGDSSFESTTFACGALMIEICVTNIASAESTRMTSSSCHRKALNRQDLYDLSDPIMVLCPYPLVQIPDFTPASFGPLPPMATMEMWSWRNSASLPLSPDLQEHMIHQKPNASEDIKSQCAYISGIQETVPPSSSNPPKK